MVKIVLLILSLPCLLGISPLDRKGKTKARFGLKKLVQKKSVLMKSAQRVSTKLIAKAIAAGVPEEDAPAVGRLLAVAESEASVFAALSEPMTLYRFLLATDKSHDKAIAWARQVAENRNQYPGTIRELMHSVSGIDSYTSDSTRSLAGCEKFYVHGPINHEGKLVREFGCVGRGVLTEDGVAVLMISVAVLFANGIMEWGNRGVLMRAYTAALEDLFQCDRAYSVEKKKLVQGLLVIDLSGMGVKAVKAYPRLKKLAEIDMGLFPPSRFMKALIVNTPSVMSIIFKSVKPLLTKQGRNITRFLGTDYGQTLKDDYGVTLPDFTASDDPHKRQCKDANKLVNKEESEEYNDKYY